MTPRRLSAVLLLVLLVLLLLPAALLALAFSDTGASTAAKLLNDHTDLVVEYGSGGLGGTLVLRRLSVPTDLANIDLRDVRTSLDARCLWRGAICLREVSAAHLEIEVTLDEAVAEEEESTPLWPLPVAVSTDSLTVARLHAHWVGGELAGERISGSVRLLGEHVHLPVLQAHHLRLLVAESDDDASVNPAELLPTVDMPADLQVDELLLYDSGWEILGTRNDYGVLRASGRWRGTQLELSDGRVSNARWGEASFGGKLTFEHPYPLEAAFRFETATPPVWAGLHHGRGDLTLAGSLAALLIDARLCAAVPLNLEGSVDVLGPSFPLTLRAEAGNCGDTAAAIDIAALPGMESFPAIELTGGWSLQVEGDTGRQQVRGQATVGGYGGYEQVKLRLQGAQSGGVLQLDPLQLADADGGQSVQLTGSLDFSAGLSADLSAVLQGVQLAPLWQPLAGAVNGTLEARGTVADGQWSLAIADVDLEGAVNGYAARARGGLRLDQDLDLQGSALDLEVNGARLRLRDAPGSEPQVQVTVDDVGRWLTGADGRLAATLRWDRDGRALRLEGVARDFHLGDARSGPIEVVGHFHYGDLPTFSLSAQTAEALLGETRLEGVAVALRGSPQRHEIVLGTSGDIAAETTVTGALDGGDWRGTLLPTALGLAGEVWRLADPVSLQYRGSESVLSLDDHCWRQEGATLCVSDALLGPSGHLVTDLQADLRAVAGLLPPRYSATGDMEAHLDARWSDLALQQLAASLRVGPGRLDQLQLGGQRAELDWDGLSLDYSGDRRQGRMTGHFTRRGSERLQLDLTMPTAADGRLSGTLAVADIDVANIGPFIGRLRQLQGTVTGELAFRGRVEAPLIEGSIALRDGVVMPLGSPTHFRDVNLAADFRGDRAVLDGEFLVGEGRSRLQGELTWLDGARMHLAVSGDSKHILYPADSVVVAAEDVAIDLTTARVALSGAIDIFRGDVELEVLPATAVEVSDDVVLLDATGMRQPETTGAPVEIDLQVRIADDLEVSAEGVSGRLGGELRLYRPLRKPLQVLGAVNVLQGRFDLLGPRFDITRGQLSFVGAADNPQLDVVMEREITQEQVTVGIRVGGTLAQPLLDFYSRPPLPEVEVMAYALGGRGVDRTGDANALALALAATSGYMQSSGLLKGVSLGVEGRDSNTRAVIGGQLSDRIYLSYGVGLYQPVNTLTVRLDLLRNLWMEVVSGLQGSADLYYSWSR